MKNNALEKTTDPIKENTKKDNDWLKRKCKQRPKFLCDENLPANTSYRLSVSGYNALSIYDIKCTGKPDEIIYMEAYKAGRIFLTHDHDFLNNRKFELKFSTPTIILPTTYFEKALSLVLYYIAPYFQLFIGTKVQISPRDYSFHLTLQNTSTGAIEDRWYRFKNGDLEEFSKN